MAKLKEIILNSGQDGTILKSHKEDNNKLSKHHVY